MAELSEPLTLKCGLTLPNRLVKAAMAEQMAKSNGLPNEKLFRAYSQWAEGGWGMLLTGMSSITSFILDRSSLPRKCLRRPGLSRYALRDIHPRDYGCPKPGNSGSLGPVLCIQGHPSPHATQPCRTAVNHRSRLTLHLRKDHCTECCSPRSGRGAHSPRGSDVHIWNTSRND